MKTLLTALLVSGLMLAQGAMAGNEPTAPAAAPAQPTAAAPAQPAASQPATQATGQGSQTKATVKKDEKKKEEAAKTAAPVVEKK